jgi:ABC-type branched-subunit amino acid transport system ATPase component/branched-subunit amino acid ABC-type transport system permease component
MSDLLPFIVSGLATGALLGLAGSGLVLSYKTSGIFNFGYGALLTAATYLFYWLHNVHGWNWELAAFVSVFVAGPVLGYAMEQYARRLAPQPVALKIVGTVGLILIVEGLATLKFGPVQIVPPQFLPKGTDSFTVGGVNILYGYLIVTVIACLAVAGLLLLFRYTRLGLAMRAVVDSPDLLATKAINPVGVRRFAWILSSTLAALSGVLIAPFVGLAPIALTLLVVQAFGAAAVGAFSSIPLTFVGGLVIGVGGSISTKYVVSTPWLSGLPDSLPFILLLVVLLVLPRRRLITRSLYEKRPALQWHASPPVRLLSSAIVLAGLISVPAFAGVKLPYYTLGLTEMILFLSLGLLVRTSGQVSLCHTIFAAVGAVAFAQLAVGHHVPWLVAMLLAALIVVPVGALVAIPAIRLSGLFLALATFGFGIMVEQMIYPQSFMFGSFASGRTIPRPSFAQGDTAYYYLVLAFVVVVAAAMLLISGSRLGRMLRGLSDSPTALSVMGLSTNMTRVIVFCISAAFAGIAGVLYGGSVNVAASSDSYFSSFNSLILIAVLAIAPFAAVPWYAVIAGLTFVIPGYLTGSSTPSWLNVIFGVSVIFVAIQGGPQTMPVNLRRYFQGGRLPSWRRHAAAVSDTETKPAGWSDHIVGSGLSVNDLTVRFGGITAVKSLNLAVPTGRITGLIGPNGAGKTTTFNSCFGLNRPSSGRILLNDRDLSRHGPAARGRAGLGRTFQIVELCESLTVSENVALGREAGMAGGNVFKQLWASAKERNLVSTSTAAAMEICGIAHLADRQAGGLSTGERRLVELARCLAGPFEVLLLDEPSSGLDRDETQRFAEVLQRVAAERGSGVLLVEHDMTLVMAVCAYLYVLDFGRLLFEGTPEAVAASPVVQSAYLGVDSETSARLDTESDEAALASEPVEA